MTTKIVLSGMEFHGFHGVFAEEHKFGARFVVDVELLIQFGGTDDVASTADYGAVFAIAERFVTQHQFALIETLAEQIATRVLALERVQATTVRVHKPHAPLPGVFNDVYVEVTRERHS